MRALLCERTITIATRCTHQPCTFRKVGTAEQGKGSAAQESIAIRLPGARGRMRVDSPLLVVLYLVALVAIFSHGDEMLSLSWVKELLIFLSIACQYRRCSAFRLLSFLWLERPVLQLAAPSRYRWY